RVTTRQDRGAARRAGGRRRVEGRKPRPFLREGVEVGRGDVLRAEAGQVVVADVIPDDVDDVDLLVGGPGAPRQEGKERQRDSHGRLNPSGGSGDAEKKTAPEGRSGAVRNLVGTSSSPS